MAEAAFSRAGRGATARPFRAGSSRIILFQQGTSAEAPVFRDLLPQTGRYISSDATGQLPIAVETIPTFFGNAPAQEDGMTQRLMQMVN